MNVENSQEKNWQRLKEQYLKQVEDALAESGQVNIEGIVDGVRSHLERRYAELSPLEQTWENFQKIITEMGPPSEYAELAGEGHGPEKKGITVKYVAVLAVFLALLTGGLILLPVLLPKRQFPTWTDKMKSAFAPKQQDKQETQAAIEAAKSWLKLVDEGAYEQSWTESAEFFRKNVPPAQWLNAINGVRKPLGKVLSRKVLNSKYTTAMPGAPDGKYVIIQFETSFENKQSAVETVTPMMDIDRKWRVSGYYIK